MHDLTVRIKAFFLLLRSGLGRTCKKRIGTWAVFTNILAISWLIFEKRNAPTNKCQVARAYWRQAWPCEREFIIFCGFRKGLSRLLRSHIETEKTYICRFVGDQIVVEETAKVVENVETTMIETTQEVNNLYPELVFVYSSGICEWRLSETKLTRVSNNVSCFSRCDWLKESLWSEKIKRFGSSQDIHHGSNSFYSSNFTAKELSLLAFQYENRSVKQKRMHSWFIISKLTSIYPHRKGKDAGAHGIRNINNWSGVDPNFNNNDWVVIHWRWLPQVQIFSVRYLLTRFSFDPGWPSASRQLHQPLPKFRPINRESGTTGAWMKTPRAHLSSQNLVNASKQQKPSCDSAVDR